MFKRGDKVSVVGTVKYDQSGDDKWLHLDVIGASVSCGEGDVTLISIAVEPGDRVSIKGDDMHGKWHVLAVDDADAWVKDEQGNSKVETVADLERWSEWTTTIPDMGEVPEPPTMPADPLDGMPF